MLPLAKIYQIREREPDSFPLQGCGGFFLGRAPLCDTALSRTALPSPQPVRVQGCASQIGGTEPRWAAGQGTTG